MWKGRGYPFCDVEGCKGQAVIHRILCLVFFFVYGNMEYLNILLI